MKDFKTDKVQSKKLFKFKKIYLLLEVDQWRSIVEMIEGQKLPSKCWLLKGFRRSMFLASMPESFPLFLSAFVKIVAL